MQFFILQSQAGTSAASYLPILIQLLFAGGLITMLLLLSNFLGPKRKGTDKLQNFESGIAITGNARQPVSIKYFLVAILFVLFDVE
ncbi:MAG TPA: NADH-quinone oxidoreductase subunit A, partial [Ferruginibacter sp.]|nr:NADH-quinone oxidoreductase subunit A [Ferruginibacter sp.]